MLTRVLKRVSLFALAIIIFVCDGICNASAEVAFLNMNLEQEGNCIFVNVSSRSDTVLGACLVTFHFSKGIVPYRVASVVSEKSDTFKYTKSDNTLKIILSKPKGQAVTKSKTRLFKITVKKGSTGEFSFKSAQCVDIDSNLLKVSTGGSISLSNVKNSVPSGMPANSSSKASDNSQVTSAKLETNSEKSKSANESKNSSSTDVLSSSGSLELAEDDKKPILIGIFAVICFVGALIISYKFGKTSNNKKDVETE